MQYCLITPLSSVFILLGSNKIHFRVYELIKSIQRDSERRKNSSNLVKPHLSCEVHKDYKEYQVLLFLYMVILRCFLWLFELFNI